MSDLVKQFAHDESIKKKCEEFYIASSNILETLEKIDREIQEYLPCTIKTLKDQENRLYVRRFFLFEDVTFFVVVVDYLESTIRNRYDQWKYSSIIKINSSNRTGRCGC